MPTEFASAIADLRLSPDKLPQDFAQARRTLLRLTRQLEQEAAIQVSVGVDFNKAQRDLNRAITRLATSSVLTIPVRLDADGAIDELGALQGALDPLLLSVAVNADQALDELGALQSVTDPIAFPVTIQSDVALAELAALGNIADPVEVPVVAFTDPAASEIGALRARAEADPVSIPVDLDTTGVDADINSVVSQTLPRTVQSFGAAGQDSGAEFASRFTSITTAAIGGLSVVLGGFLATSLVRGFQRLTTIQDATASLTVALGSASAAARTLDDVLDVVTGTPFNLDQFATAASNLISFGVEADKVPLYLEAIGEAAATRGSRANEFAQRLATTFGQVSVQGRIMGEDILSLQATGVDALRILGNEFGKTTIEIREMISEGAVPADEALQVLSDGILNGSTGINGATVAFAGTMERLRETLTGAIGGFQSSTARLGVAIIKPFEDVLIEGFNAATDIVNQFNSTITDALSGLGDSEGFENFIDFIAELPDKIDPLIDTLQGLGPALAPLAAAFGAQGLGALSSLLGPLGNLIPTLNPLVAAIGAFIAFTPELRDELGPVLVDLGESFAILSAGLGVALGDALEEITPLLVQVIGVLGDLSPTIATVAALAVALADGFVPVLGTLADLLEGFPVEALLAIGGGFLAFKAIGSLQAPISGLTNRMAGLSTSLQLAEANGERFGSTMTRVAGAVGLTGANTQRAAQALNTSLNVAAASAAGFFSGMATQSEDATIQITGFLGAATSIGTAFATGGPIGGIAASAAVVGGALVSMWVDSKRAAEEYARDIEQLAEEIIDDMGRATAALLEARDLIGEESVVEASIELIGEDELLRLKTYGVELADFLALANEDPEFADNFRRQLDDIEDQATQRANARVRAAEAAGEPAAGIRFGEFYAEEFLTGFQAAVAARGSDPLELGNLVELDDLGQIDTDNLDDVLGYLDGVTGLLDDTTDEIGRQAAIAEQEAQALFAGLVPNPTAQEALREAADAAGLDIDGLVEKLQDAKSFLGGADGIEALFAATVPDEIGLTPFEIITEGLEEVEDRFGYTIEVAEDGSIKFVEATDDMAGGMSDAQKAAEEMAAGIDAAMKAAEASTGLFNDKLDDMLDKLDAITEQQDYAAGFREIGATLSEIVNTEDLREAERLIESIGDQRDSLADLEAKLAEEQVDANITLFELDNQIADAESKGAVKIAAALRQAKQNVVAEVDEIGREIADKKAEIGGLEAELAAIGQQIPTTLAELLQQQANQAGLSLFDFLVAAPTEESQAFFQGSLVPQIQAVGTLIQRSLEENPLLANVEIPSLVEGLITGLAASGLDEATARALVEQILDPAELARQATEVFADEFNADIAQLSGITAALLRGETIDPSIDVKAIVDDVTGGIAELTAAERDGIDIPTDVDLIAAQESLSAFNQAYENSDFALVIPIEGDLSTIIAQIQGLETYDIQMVVRSAAPDGLGPTFGNSAAGNTSFTPWWEGNFNQTTRTGGGGGRPSQFLADGGILQFFKDGGVSENHIAQLVHGGTTRVWKEPETHGEAYIPLAQSKRSRSTQILQSVADIFGLDLIPRGIGPLDSSMAEDSMARAVERGVKSAGVPGPGARARAHDQAARSVVVEKIEVNGVKDPNRAARRVMRELSDVALGMHRWDD